MSAAKTKAQGIIDDNAVGLSASYPELLQSVLMLPTAVFSKSYCPYCKASKTLLTELGAKFHTIELDQVGTFYI